jgi:hypothetical protein
VEKKYSLLSLGGTGGKVPWQIELESPGGGVSQVGKNTRNTSTGGWLGVNMLFAPSSELLGGWLGVNMLFAPSSELLGGLLGEASPVEVTKSALWVEDKTK